MPELSHLSLTSVRCIGHILRPSDSEVMTHQVTVTKLNTERAVHRNMPTRLYLGLRALQPPASHRRSSNLRYSLENRTAFDSLSGELYCDGGRPSAFKRSATQLHLPCMPVSTRYALHFHSHRSCRPSTPQLGSWRSSPPFSEWVGRSAHETKDGGATLRFIDKAPNHDVDTTSHLRWRVYESGRP